MELPRAIKSEEAILGAIIAYPNNVVKVVDLLKAEDFYHTKHIKIYREIKSLYGEGLVIDISTLAQTLLSKGILQEVGGVTYLSELSTGATYSENIEYHCEIILDRSNKRQTIKILNEARERVYDTKINCKDIISYCVEEFYKISNENSKMYTLPECIESTYIEIEKRFNKKGDNVKYEN